MVAAVIVTEGATLGVCVGTGGNAVEREGDGKVVCVIIAGYKASDKGMPKRC